MQSDAQADVFDIVREYNGEARLLAALFYSSRLAQGVMRLALRDFWRNFVIGTAFVRSLETTCGFPPGSCPFEPKVKVRRPVIDRISKSLVKCLVVCQLNTLPTAEGAKALLQEWMRYEELDYYRISFNLPDGKLQVLYLDVLDKTGLYWDEVTSSEEPFTAVEPITRSWDAALLELLELANQANERLRYPKVGVQRATKKARMIAVLENFPYTPKATSHIQLKRLPPYTAKIRTIRIYP